MEEPLLIKCEPLNLLDAEEPCNDEHKYSNQVMIKIEQDNIFVAPSIKGECLEDIKEEEGVQELYSSDQMMVKVEPDDILVAPTIREECLEDFKEPGVQVCSILPSDEGRLIKTRKRPINPSEWACNKRKRLRDSGQSYISKRGAEVPAKTVPTMARVCNSETCYKRGCMKLSLQTKVRLYHKYYSRTYDEQSALLVSFMKLTEVRRRRGGRNDATSSRTCTVQYTIDNLEVCRKTFLDTFQITKRRVETLQKKMKNNIGVPIDDRGKYKNKSDNNVIGLTSH